MNEGSWEWSRRQARKRILLSLLVVLPIVLLAVILFINNRDLLRPGQARSTGSGADETPSAAGKKANPVQKSEPVQINTTAVTGSDSPEIHPRESVRKISDKEESTVKKGGSEAIPKVKLPRTGTRRQASVVIPPFPCTIESRKDMVIRLSLELLFDDSDMREAILLRREDIRVMVMRAMRMKTLSEMKIGSLESHLQKNINSIFDTSVITAVRIRNIQVEKAVHK